MSELLVFTIQIDFLSIKKESITTANLSGNL